MEAFERAELAVHAEHALVLCDGVDEQASLVDVARDGFLERHVLARAQCQQRHRHVPVIGRADHHRVDVGAGEHVTEVAIRGAARVRARR